MINQLPLYVNVIFALTTLLTLWLFYTAAHESKVTLAIMLGWLALQAVLGLSGFYQQTQALPPRFPVLIVPPLLLLVTLLATRRGRRFIDRLRLDQLTLLHTIRILVELVLLWLFIGKTVPQLMTFEGRNFDILSGLTAPFVYYFGFVKKRIGRPFLVLWNLVCLGLLINIVVNAVLSTPSRFQAFAFDQPNVAILYFPYVWLPSFIVPVVLMAHVSALRQLIRRPLGNKIGLATDGS
jgi:hypothetical protein